MGLDCVYSILTHDESTEYSDQIWMRAVDCSNDHEIAAENGTEEDAIHVEYRE